MDEIILNTKESLNINSFLEASEGYLEENFPDINLENFFDDTLTGNIKIDLLNLNVFESIKIEVLENLQIIVSILIVILIHSIFKIINENLKDVSTGKVASFIQYLIIVSLVLNIFIKITENLKIAIDKLVLFMNMFVPLITTIMIASGNIITSNVMKNTLFGSIFFVSNFLKSFVIPFFMISVTLFVISNFSDKVKMEKLSAFFKNTTIWILGIALTIFISVLSIEGTIADDVDDFTAKTSKAVISNFIPVVGKIMGDSVDAVIGSFGIIKNSVGIIGIVFIILITLLPAIKIFVMYLMFNLVGAFSEIVAEEKITKLLMGLTDNIKVLLGIYISIIVMFIIQIVIMIRVTGG